MDQKTLHAFESKCTQEESPSCQTECPLHVEARSFALLMAKGDMLEARRVLDRSMPLSVLAAYLCEGPCIKACKRSSLDSGLNMPMLERACANNSTWQKPFILPDTKKRIVIFGSELSSLSLASELVKKGHGVRLYHAEEAIGPKLRKLDSKTLPENALNEAIERLEEQKVIFEPMKKFLLSHCLEALKEASAIYVGFDDPNIREKDFFDGAEKRQSFFIDDLTLETNLDKIFAGCQSGSRESSSFIWALAAGKRSAGSIERSMQGASPSISREKDRVYKSTLYTNLKDIPKKEEIKPQDPLDPSLDEAIAEAKRCIDCQCLECVKVCPYLRKYKGYPKKLSREMFNNFGLLQGNRQSIIINSCAECNLCEAVCPTGANLGTFCATMRSKLVAKEYQAPSAFEFALEDMDYSSTLSFLRTDPSKKRNAYLFFPGCQLPGALPEETKSVYKFLKDNLKGGIGLWFDCCGIPASWAGEDKKADSRLNKLKKDWEAAGKPKLILACASCSLYFSQKAPEIECLSLWEILKDMQLPAGIEKTNQILALHDPCSARDKKEILDSSRQIASAIGQELEELELSKNLTRCCGYGGLCYNSNPDLAAEFAKDRAADTEKPLLVYCSICLLMLKKSGKEAVHLLSLLFPPTEIKDKKIMPHELLSKRAPGFSDCQENRARFRDFMLHNYWNEALSKEDPKMKIKLNIPDEVAEKLEQRKILRSDLRSVLSRKSSNAFYNESTGHTLACYRPRKVSFWVEYSKSADETFTIHDAYCHRMLVPGVPEAEAGEDATDSCC